MPKVNAGSGTRPSAGGSKRKREAGVVEAFDQAVAAQEMRTRVGDHVVRSCMQDLFRADRWHQQAEVADNYRRVRLMQMPEVGCLLPDALPGVPAPLAEAIRKRFGLVRDLYLGEAPARVRAHARKLNSFGLNAMTMAVLAGDHAALDGLRRAKASPLEKNADGSTALDWTVYTGADQTRKHIKDIFQLEYQPSSKIQASMQTLRQYRANGVRVGISAANFLAVARLSPIQCTEIEKFFLGSFIKAARDKSSRNHIGYVGRGFFACETFDDLKYANHVFATRGVQINVRPPTYQLDVFGENLLTDKINDTKSLTEIFRNLLANLKDTFWGPGDELNQENIEYNNRVAFDESSLKFFKLLHLMGAELNGIRPFISQKNGSNNRSFSEYTNLFSNQSVLSNVGIAVRKNLHALAGYLLEHATSTEEKPISIFVPEANEGRGKSVDIPNDSLTPAMHASRSMVGLLLDMGVPPGPDHLLAATEHGKTEIMRMLMDAGVSVNAANQFGRTILHTIAKEKGGSGRLVDWDALDLGGADCNKPDRNGNTPLHVLMDSRLNHRWTAGQKLGFFEAMRRAMEQSDGTLNLFAVNKAGETPLDVAGRQDERISGNNRLVAEILETARAAAG